MIAAERLPAWADEWMDGTCRCGSRLVKVHDMTGAEHTVCKVSGWDNVMCERPCRVPASDLSQTSTGVDAPPEERATTTSAPREAQP